MQEDSLSNTGSLRRLHSTLKSLFSPHADKLKQPTSRSVEKIEKTASLEPVSQVRVIKYKHASVQTDCKPVSSVYCCTGDLEEEEDTEPAEDFEKVEHVKKEGQAGPDKRQKKAIQDQDEEELPKLIGKVSIRRRSTSTESLSAPKPRRRLIKFDKVAVLLDAAANGELAELRSLLEGGTPLHIDSCTSDGVTALHAAAGALQTATVKYLLGLGAHVNAADGSGNTPLHLAAAHGDLLLAQLLIEAGASVESQNADKLTAEQATPFADIREYLRLVLQRKMVSDRVTAIYDFNRHTVLDGRGDEVSVGRGEQLTVLDRRDPEWWLVERENGQRGYVPRMLVQ